MLRNLRDFGFGKSSMEDLFQEEAEKLCNVLSKTAGNQTSFQTHGLFSCFFGLIKNFGIHSKIISLCMPNKMQIVVLKMNSMKDF